MVAFGSVETSLRARVVEVRRRLMGSVPAIAPKRAPVVRTVLVDAPKKRLTVRSDETLALEAELRKPAAPSFRRRIMLEVCEKHGITFGQLVGQSRAKVVVSARHEAWFRLYQESASSSVEIGRLTLHDHATVLYGIKKHAALLAGMAPEGERRPS